MNANQAKGKISWTPAGRGNEPKPDRYGARTWRGQGQRGVYEWVKFADGLWSAYFDPADATGTSVELALRTSAGKSFKACTEHNRPGMAGAGRGA